MANKNSKNNRATSRVSAKTTTQKPRKTSAQAKPQSKQTPNQWRNEPGVGEPLRVGRGIRTRDEFIAGQGNKNIHPEINKDELYRRGVVLDIDDDQNIAIVKTHNLKKKQHPEIPDDKQRRRYEREILTASGNNSKTNPIHIQSGKFELAPEKDNVSEKQAKSMLSDIEKSSKKNRKRLGLFRQNKKKEGR